MLFYPLDYQAGQRYPLVVQTHGGPQASDKFGFGRWGNYTQVLAAKGYVVLQAQLPRQHRLRRRVPARHGRALLQNAHLDVMTGVDHLIAHGLVDGDRMVKMGWSGGGHMTNKIITFTDRFKAASSGAGAANWISMYAQSDVRTYRTPWFGGTPWQKNAPIDVYWEHSPLKYVANVKTPTHLPGRRRGRAGAAAAVGGDVPGAQEPTACRRTSTWRRASRTAGSELRHELFKVNVELDWFEEHVTKRPYTWEKAPGDDAAKPATTTAERQIARRRGVRPFDRAERISAPLRWPNALRRAPLQSRLEARAALLRPTCNPNCVARRNRARLVRRLSRRVDRLHADPRAEGDRARHTA